MPWYRCFIRGENFPGQLAGSEVPVGFYTTRFVKADSPEHAEDLALMKLKEERKLKKPKGSGESEARVFFEEIAETRPPSWRERRSTGFAFYEMEIQSDS